MEPPEQDSCSYQDYIQQLLRQSEEPTAIERKISLKYLAHSLKVEPRQHPTIRLPVPRPKRILRNQKLISLIQRSNQQRKKQDSSTFDGWGPQKRQWNLQVKVINKPRIPDLCNLSPKKYIEHYQLNLRSIRHQNETYLRAKDNEIKQKIKNKHKKVKTQPSSYFDSPMLQVVTRPAIKVRHPYKYDDKLQEKLVRKSISISRCFPLTKNIQDIDKNAEKDMQMMKKLLHQEPSRSLDTMMINHEGKRERSIESQRQEKTDRPKLFRQMLRPRKKVQYHHVFVNQLNEFKSISQFNQRSPAAELAVGRSKNSQGADQSNCPLIKPDSERHYSNIDPKQHTPQPTKHYSAEKDSRFIKQSLFKRLGRERTSLIKTQSKTKGIGSIHETNLSDSDSSGKGLQKKRVVFSNKNIHRGEHSLGNALTKLAIEEQL